MEDIVERLDHVDVRAPREFSHTVTQGEREPRSHRLARALLREHGEDEEAHRQRHLPEVRQGGRALSRTRIEKEEKEWKISR